MVYFLGERTVSLGSSDKVSFQRAVSWDVRFVFSPFTYFNMHRAVQMSSNLPMDQRGQKPRAARRGPGHCQSGVWTRTLLSVQAARHRHPGASNRCPFIFYLLPACPALCLHNNELILIISDDRPFFTRDPTQLRGEKLQAKLVKSTKGLGFTIVGGDDSEEEFLQIKSVVPNGPAWLDGKLKTGDVLVYVNGTCVLGFTHHDMVTMFQSIGPGEVVGLDVCRGYPLPFDPDDPNTEIVTTVAVTSPEQGEWANELERQRSSAEVEAAAAAHSHQSMPDLWRGQPGPGSPHKRPGSADLLMSDRERDSKLENGGPHPQLNGHDTSAGDGGGFNPNDLVTIPIVKGGMGFGFTIADSAFGQKVKKILDRPRCKKTKETF